MKKFLFFILLTLFFNSIFSISISKNSISNGKDGVYLFFDTRDYNRSIISNFLPSLSDSIINDKSYKKYTRNVFSNSWLKSDYCEVSYNYSQKKFFMNYNTDDPKFNKIVNYLRKNNIEADDGKTYNGNDILKANLWTRIEINFDGEKKQFYITDEGLSLEEIQNQMPEKFNSFSLDESHFSLIEPKCQNYDPEIYDLYYRYYFFQDDRFTETIINVIPSLKQISNSPSLTIENSFSANEELKVKEISTGYKTICALQNNGKVQCLGEETYFSGIENLNNVKNISAGVGQTCALLENGNVKCFGNKNYFSGIENLQNVKQVSAGERYTCALKNDKKVQCFGEKKVLIGAVENVKQITTGNKFTCALREDGTNICFDGLNI